MTTFNIEDFSSFFKGSDAVSNMVFMARTAESAERYEDMCEFMKALVHARHEQKKPLTVDERNLLSVAFKNVIGAKRNSWRHIGAQDDKDNLSTTYCKIVSQELETTCADVIALLTEKLVGNLAYASEEDKAEANVFYYKMAGDYYRYLAEAKPSKANAEKAKDNYEAAYKEAVPSNGKGGLPATHPIRLGLALNYSVCYYEILKDRKEACDLAKSAFDQAIAELDKLDENDYKDSTLIMQLLRDNLTLWTSSDDNDEQVQVEDLSDEEN
jgi:hypothetical protein